MKIAIFYRDLFFSGGLPGEIRSITEAMVVDHEVTLAGLNSKLDFSLPDGVHICKYTNFFDLNRKISGWLGNERPDILLVVGFFMYENLFVAKIARRLCVPVILSPCAHVTDELLAAKIFVEDPDIRNLESKKRNRQSLKQRFLIKINPYLKWLYIKSIGRVLVANSDLIAVFSENEKEQFKKHFIRSDDDFVTLFYGINEVSSGLDDEFFYNSKDERSDKIFNYVYWGRMDWYYKGLDRLLNGVIKVRDDLGEAAVPFRIYLIGPDYRGGAETVKSYIEKNNLARFVHLLLPSDYKAGSKAPLRDADASICLSRWDGFPRTLRESTLLDVPVLVSKETNFGSLTRDYSSGIVLENADNPDEVADALLTLADERKRLVFKKGALSLSPDLSWHAVSSCFIHEVDGRMNLSN